MIKKRPKSQKVERFYRVNFPGYPYDFAYVSISNKPAPFACMWCRHGVPKWEEPLRVEWGKESPGVVGDFTPLPLGSHTLVSNRVRSAIESRFQGFKFHPVMQTQERTSARSYKTQRLLFPDDGPLWWLEPTVVVPMNQEEYQWKVEEPCPQCGSMRFSPPSWFYVKEEDLRGAHLFLIELRPEHIYLTEELKEFIMEQRFSNIATQYIGPIIPKGENPRSWVLGQLRK